MSFYTSLTGLNAATAQLGVTANNVANVSTVGFKRSRTDFGDIFATSPLQKATATIGQGVALKRVSQEFGQGNLNFSSNTLDLAISGDGFFPLKSQDGFQDIFTRNGSFMMNDQYNVVNSAGQKLMAASVDSSGKANLTDMNVLTIPQKTTGMAKQTSKIQLGLNFPADAPVIEGNFNRNDPTTYSKSSAMTVYDAGGNSYLATIYYAKTLNASAAVPNNRWQTYVYVGDNLVSASLQQATDKSGQLLFVNKYGQLKSAADFTTPDDIAALNSSFSKKTIKFSLDQLTNTQISQPATITAGVSANMGTGSNDGVDIASYLNMTKSSLLRQQGCSAATYALDPNVVGPVSVTFGPSNNPVVVTIPANGAQAPGPLDIASALNANSSFVASYVAEASHTSASITNINFDNLPPPAVGSNPFSSFSINVGGQQFNIDNLSSTDIDTASLVTDLQAKLQAQDGLTPPQLTVTFDSLTNKLTVNDLAQRDITGVKLKKSPSANGATGNVSVGNSPEYGDVILKITALEPNVSASDLVGNISSPGITIAQNGTTLPVLNVTPQQTPYTRAKAVYTLANSLSNGFSATFGTPPVTVEAGSTADLVSSLNKNAVFSAHYLASYDALTQSFTVTAQDPTNALATSITNAVRISENNGDPSVPMTVITDVVATSGVPAILDMGKHSIDDLRNLFTINVDNSANPVSVGLDGLVASMQSLPASQSKRLSGTQIAAELTNEIARSYGGEKPFNFSTVPAPTFSLQLTRSDGTNLTPLPIDLSSSHDMRREDLVKAVQTQIDNDPFYSGNISVTYNTQLQKLIFTPADNSKITVTSEQSVMNLVNPLVQGVNDQSVGLPLSPAVTAQPFRSLNDQRYGMSVEYDAVKQSFVFHSGSTGDTSSIAISNIRPGSLATLSSKGLGLTGDPANYSVSQSSVDAVRGIASKPAVLVGNPLAINVDNNFSVDDTNNQFVVSVNGITGTVVIPPKDTYTMGTFMEALQSGINNIQGPIVNGLTPQSISGVQVTYNASKNALQFTTGTASSSTYIKVSGDGKWGLDGLNAQFGTTTSWIKPTPYKDAKGGAVYIDSFGKETSTATGFDTLPAWSPIYFEKGELTFDTAGNLISPTKGSQLDTVYLPNGKGALTISVDYSKSTQFASPFSVLSQSQDGAPEGDLVGLAIKDDGLVSASYSNGSQKSLGKVVLVNFSNPTGLRQIGDTNYYKSTDSGNPKYSEAGSAGFGTIKSGATERANVDLTQELVDLITEQRNFQANAKAMETSTSMTSTIIQIRN